MPQTCGQYIDSLTDEQRDRLVEQKDFNSGFSWWGPGGCGCLVGTAEGGVPSRFSKIMRAHDRVQLRHYDARPNWTMLDIPWRDAPASIRYPKLVRRFGKERVVRAIKLRAGARVVVTAGPEAVTEFLTG